MELYRMESITFGYEKKRPILENINLKIEKGEKIVLLGQNGAGKSTLLFLLKGILKPQKGALFCEGERVVYNKQFMKKITKDVGVVFQNPDLQIVFSEVKDEIAYGPKNLGWSDDKIRNGIDKIVKLMDIEYLLEKSTYFLSAGEKKLVSIADILIMEPKIIIFDEPFTWLDNYYSEILKKILKTLENMGITLIIITHNMNFAYEWADRAIVLSDKKIVFDDEIEKLFERRELLRKTHLDLPIALKVMDMLVKEGKLKKEYSRERIKV